MGLDGQSTVPSQVATAQEAKMRASLLAIGFLLGSLPTSILATAQTLQIVPTTTLQAETANNTSAADTFPGLSNGNAAAGSASKLDLHSLLYPGATTQIYAELQPWFGDKRHINVGYTSWDPVQVEKQLEDMESRGVTGVVIDWYGPADRTELTTLAWLAAAANHPNFKILIMIDKGAVTLSPCPGCNPQQTMIYLTNYVLQHYATSPSYATLDGKPIITQFDLDLHFTLDWPAIEAATSSNVVWIFENSGGFNHPMSGGSWSWMNATSKQYGMDYLTHFYNVAITAPTLQTWGAAYKGFNDTVASWSLARVVGQQCGQTWLDTFQKINSYYDSGKQLPILQLVTWNDYEEGTEMETGIDNCVSVSASASSNSLNWQIKGQENTIDHYQVFISRDGVNLMALNALDVGSQSLDLCGYSLANGNYVAYVEAVGKPTLKNKISNAVNFSSTCGAFPTPTPIPTHGASSTINLRATPTAIEIPSGLSGSTSVDVIPVGGAMRSLITLSCTNLPLGLQCSFSPASVTPGMKTATSTLQISANGNGPPIEEPRPGTPRPSAMLLMNLGVAGLAIAGGISSKMRSSKRLKSGIDLKKTVRRWVLVGTLGVMAGMLVGCSIGPAAQNPLAVPAVAGKTYTITLNGDGGSQHTSTPVTVTVR
jgi:hypothetical protein